MRIGVAGMNGRVGALLPGAIGRAGATFAGGTVRPGAALPADAVPDIAALAARCDVVIDFTPAGATVRHAEVLAACGTAWVVGTTGLDATAERAINRAAAAIAVVQAANFSPGVNLLLAVAQRLAAALDPAEYDAEIVEMHHRAKRDAPSGTALAIGRAVAAGRGQDFDAVAIPARAGAAGARPAGGIGFAALRGGAVVGEHMLLLTSEAEQIAIGDRVFDRRVFADGAVRAALWTGGRAPGRYGMGDVLGLAAF